MDTVLSQSVLVDILDESGVYFGHLDIIPSATQQFFFILISSRHNLTFATFAYQNGFGKKRGSRLTEWHTV